MSASARKVEIMSVINMAKSIKQVHPDSLICYKVGNFYHSYGKDAYILSYLFDYKINKLEENVSVSGFPKNAISKVMATVERKKLNYIIIDTRNNYNVDDEVSYDNLNKYNEIFEKAHKAVKLKRRVGRISETLLREEDLEKIRKIEEIVYENRKV